MKPVRFETIGPLVIAGLSGHHASGNAGATIAPQWMRFAPWLGKVPGQVGEISYGVSTNCNDAGFDYLCGVPVSDAAAVAAPLTTVTIPAYRYAVFEHQGHVSTFTQTLDAIFASWVPQTGGGRLADVLMFERYDQRFDAASGMGLIEIWIPAGGAA